MGARVALGGVGAVAGVREVEAGTATTAFVMLLRSCMRKPVSQPVSMLMCAMAVPALHPLS